MIWLLNTILLPFLSALLCLILGQRPRLARIASVVGASLTFLNSILLLNATIREGYISFQGGSWDAPIGITLIADVFSASMVCITGVVTLAVAVYSIKDINDPLVKKHFFALFHFLIMGVSGAFITGDLFNLYVWFEVMLLASFVLVTLGGSKDQLEGGVKYLVINIISSVLFLAGLGLQYGKLGTLNMAHIAQKLAVTDDAFFVNSSAMLLLVAFGIKAGLFPFFFWLPASYHTPRVSVSAVFAGLLTKVGVYALIRAYTLFYHSQFHVVQDLLLWLAAATMVTGVLGAASHFDIRKILSFHIISQIGYMVMGLAIGTSLAVTAAIFYILHHIIVKTNLFLISGLIMRKSGSSHLYLIGGLYRMAPWISLIFLIPAFSLGGIPPLSGFWAKLGVIQAGVDSGYYALVITSLLVGIFTLFSMTKIWAEAFWKNHPDADKPHTMEQQPNLPLEPSLVAPCVVLSLMTLAIGLYSEPLFELAELASKQLLSPDLYIQHVLKQSL
ncbi:multisubunit sodium/proton antiporter, MrpD subunit (TC 2.A.63.1) [Rubritalea squalenifaciens DSM 18772]|uniref:Multisubunit sodium/proton antiporter, MrpD subunit (TC 2.A.63.1) n=1 Tax=Rubritalea squalenifaciens DSM 18772 TaxID=1123071 RepID=A0A1M6DRK2_9BACT|nr:Na+/H+ antiporter subunit D [Rubritalea squalenifaciens]SHI75750.1 multisubunit sodium/proton antiporter, MrpD subunit (TC 2.A.63.1) [Rubritalea squalenifaciens DSM 18772]